MSRSRTNQRCISESASGTEMYANAPSASSRGTRNRSERRTNRDPGSQRTILPRPDCRLRHDARAVAADEQASLREALDRVRFDRKVGRQPERRLRDEAADDRRELESVAGKSERDAQPFDAGQG